MTQTGSPQIFAIDWDGTFNAAPDLWSEFAARAQSRGHRVYVVTARRDTDEARAEIRSMLREHDCVLPIVFTEMGSKLHAMRERGVKVDVWIDDEPQTVISGR
ncbi:hypothetical protein [Schlesneria sp. T3-172]|uniref:hypothetical protein n=1 Tax=Schlesneria sphaerica TaxID=3373610 RepID=UPI0037C83DC7